MPELPDVELFRRYLNASALHQCLKDVEVREPRILDHVSAAEFRSFLRKKSFEGTLRHGKNLLVQTNGSRLVRFHFGMTGFVKYFKTSDEGVHHVRIRFHFQNGYTLVYCCRRLFGRVSLENSMEAFAEVNGLGPDAMEVSLQEFREIISGSRQAVKSLLMNQSKLAGLGNLYADEVLFQSRVHPKHKAGDLGEQQVEEIYGEIHRILDYAIACKANPNKFSKSYLLPHRGKEGTCPRCGTPLKHIKVSGRTSYFCPNCQT